jgi:hypothetical protein
MTAMEQILTGAVHLLESPTAENVGRAAGLLEQCAAGIARGGDTRGGITPGNAAQVRVYLGRLTVLLEAALRSRLACARLSQLEETGYARDGSVPGPLVRRHIRVEA